MSAILIISVILIVVASLVALRSKRPQTNDAEQLPPGVRPRGLFDDGQAEQSVRDSTDAEARRNAAAELEKSLLERAERGELETLDEASATKNDALYRIVLDRHVERCTQSPSDLRSLAAYISHSDDLLSSPALAERLREEFEREPSETSPADLVRVAALSDDAGAFSRAVSAVTRAWEDGRLDGVSGGEMLSLFDAEYWLLSSEARRSGAGFHLKQELADVRRRLSTPARRVTPPSTGAPGNEVSAQRERQ